jgi:hypothetical protein
MLTSWLHDFVLGVWAFLHIILVPVCAHNVEVTAESTPPEIPITKPFTFFSSCKFSTSVQYDHSLFNL